MLRTALLALALAWGLGLFPMAASLKAGGHADPTGNEAPIPDAGNHYDPNGAPTLDAGSHFAPNG